MHSLTSNFNLIYSNSNWESLKKDGVMIDSNFDSFYLNLIDEQYLKKYDTFHILIFLDKKNFNNTKNKISSLKSFFNKYSYKPFFIYFTFSNNLNNQEIKKIKYKLLKLNKNLRNLFLEFSFQDQKKIYNNRNNSILKFPFDISIISKFTKIIRKKINIINSRPFKLIILDCDNTLWGGVLNEDRFQDIEYINKKIEYSFKDLQKKLLNLKNKGFLLSLCSKNNEKDVWKFLKKKKMELQKKDFILSRINWNEKSDNISFIVKNLNLRYEDCIFIDDNILEINKVKNKLKKINTFHLKNLAQAKDFFENENIFKKFIISKDDLKKYRQYKLKSKFTEHISKDRNVVSILKGLKQKITILNCGRNNMKRAEELFNKTNQFNFSLNRYKISDLFIILNKKNFEVKLFSLKDKFGDHGIIGSYVLEKKKDSVLISDFILSCRVLYRYVEQYILYNIIKQNSNKEVKILYKKTKVNSNLIPKFIKTQQFNLSKKNKNCFLYKVKFDSKNIDETKKIFK